MRALIYGSVPGISLTTKAILLRLIRGAAIPTWGKTAPNGVLVKLAPFPVPVPELEQGLELLWLGFPRSQRESWPFHTKSKRL